MNTPANNLLRRLRDLAADDSHPDECPERLREILDRYDSECDDEARADEVERRTRE